MLKKEIKKCSRFACADYFYLTLIVLITYGLFLGMHPLFAPDEARYSEVAREMLANHQFLTPQINNVDFFDKPILFYWLQALSMAVFGVNEWAVRLWPTLFAGFGVCVVYGTSKQLYNRKIAWVCALILASSPLYYFAAHYANLDLEVAVLITTSLCFFIRAYQPNIKTLIPGWLYAAYAAAGFAILTKGLIGIAFPVMVIGLWIVITNQWQLVRHMKILQGLGLILLITAPWFIAVEYRNPGFLYYFFYVQQFLRFLTASFNNIEPFWFYFPVILLGFLPWIPFLYPLLRQGGKLKNSISTFFIIWFAVVLVFFSIPHSKLIGYIIPTLSPLAILTGSIYDSITQSYKQKIIWSYIAIFIVLCISVWFIPQSITVHYGIITKTQAFFSIALLFLISIFVAISYFRPQFLFAALVFGNLFVFNLLLALTLLLSPQTVANLFPIKTAVFTIKPLLKPDDQLVSYFSYRQELPIYAQRTTLIVDNWDNPDLAKKDNWRGEFAYSMQYLQPEAKKQLILPAQFSALVKSKVRLFVFVPKNKLLRWSQDSNQAAFCVVYKAKKVTVFTNDLSLCASSPHASQLGKSLAMPVRERIYQSEMKMRSRMFTECERCHSERSEESSMIRQ